MRKPKKMTLSKETLRDLDPKSIRGVAGGMSITGCASDCYNTCGHTCLCTDTSCP
jgi:hypothetical protein